MAEDMRIYERLEALERGHDRLGERVEVRHEEVVRRLAELSSMPARFAGLEATVHSLDEKISLLISRTDRATRHDRTPVPWINIVLQMGGWLVALLVTLITTLGDRRP